MNRRCLYIPGVILLLCSGFSSCYTPNNTGADADNSITVTSDFDCGSIDTLVETSPGFLTGKTKHWKHKSSSDNQYYWFYFQLDNVAGKNVTIRLEDLIGIYRGSPHTIYTGRTEPVFSYDKKEWSRIEDVKYDSTEYAFLFKRKFDRNRVWIAYAHPYSYENETAFIRSLPQKNNYLQIEKLGESAESRPINLLTLTDPSVPDINKKVVFITGLQHAGEYISGFFLEGMVSFLLSDSPEADMARKKTIYKIVPMMNPDGIYHGITRFNNNMEDLNQEWDDDFTDSLHSPTEPEVAAVKKWIRKWLKKGNKIDIGLDVHSQGQEGEINILHAPTDSLRGLVNNMNKYWPVEMIPMKFSGSANQCLTDEFHILSGTFEIPQSNVNGGKYLTIEDYHSYGKGTVLGLTGYFEKNSL